MYVPKGFRSKIIYFRFTVREAITNSLESGKWKNNE